MSFSRRSRSLIALMFASPVVACGYGGHDSHHDYEPSTGGSSQTVEQATIDVDQPAVFKDLSVFVSDHETSAAAVFTENRFPGAPVVRGRRIIAGGRVRAIAVNSKVSNVATGEQGIRTPGEFELLLQIGER